MSFKAFLTGMMSTTHVLHDNIERGDTICRDEEESVCVARDFVDISHFPTRYELECRAHGVDERHLRRIVGDLSQGATEKSCFS